MESCDVTIDESNPCGSPILECAGDQEMSESIFVDGDLPALGDDEDDPLLPVIAPASELAPTTSTPAEGPTASTSTSADFKPAPAAIEGEIVSQREAT